MKKGVKQVQEICVKCGTINDSFDDLKKLCENKAEKLLETIDVSNPENTHVAFWTTGVAELICIANFFKDEDGAIHYELDFTQSTL